MKVKQEVRLFWLKSSTSDSAGWDGVSELNELGDDDDGNVPPTGEELVNNHLIDNDVVPGVTLPVKYSYNTPPETSVSTLVLILLYFKSTARYLRILYKLKENLYG